MKSINRQVCRLLLCTLPAVPACACAQDVSAAEIAEITVRAAKPDKTGGYFQGGSRGTLDGSDGTAALKFHRATTLGQTVEQISGVQNNSFGPNAGTPQIRSLAGARVSVLENGMGVSDMSAIGGNLPAAVQPFLADKIEVYQSSAAVLFGGNALGGAVDVRNSQIPDRLPEKPLQGKAEIGGGYNTPHTETFRMDGRIRRIAWHLEGLNSKISRYRIPGYSKAAVCRDRDILANNTPLRQQCQVAASFDYPFDKRLYRYVMQDYLQKGDDWRDMMGMGQDEVYSNLDYRKNSPYWTENPDYDAAVPPGSLRKLKSLKDIVPDSKGRMANSHLHNQAAAFGASYIGTRGYIGVSIGRYRYRYGVPGFAALQTRTGKNFGVLPANIDSAQTRRRLSALYRPEAAWLDNIHFQAAYTDGYDREYLGSRLSGSLKHHSSQMRLEFNHSAGSLLEGTFGADWRRRHTDSSGEDRWLPDTDTRDYGIFLAEKLSLRQWTLQLGHRYAQSRRHALLNDGYAPGRGLSAGHLARLNRRTYTLNSSHAEISWQPRAWFSGHIRYSRSQRAPEINELFAGNAHFAVLTNEHGDPRLNPETAQTWEIGSRIARGNTTVGASLYYTRFQDYLYLASTGFSYSGYAAQLPYREWRQADTEIGGLEWEWKQFFDLHRYGTGEVRLFADLVKNRPAKRPKNADPRDTQAWNAYMRHSHEGAYMPNLPTSRYGISVVWNIHSWQARAALTRYRAQKYLARNINPEIGLGGYTLLDLYVGYTQNLGQSLSLEWFLDARNLTDEEARPNNSLLKHLAPLPGRSLYAGVRAQF